MTGFTEQQAAVLMNNNPSVWNHYDREKSPRDQQHVANVSPRMFSRLADMHSKGKATTAAARAAAAEFDDHTEVSSSSSSDWDDRDQQRVRQRTSSAAESDIRQWLKTAVATPLDGDDGSLHQQEAAHTGVLHAVCVCSGTLAFDAYSWLQPQRCHFFSNISVA